LHALVVEADGGIRTPTIALTGLGRFKGNGFFIEKL